VEEKANKKPKEVLVEKHNKCKDCLYFDDVKQIGRRGYCRVNAPKAIYSSIATWPTTYWPTVSYNDWCGEFRDARVHHSEVKDPIEV